MVRGIFFIIALLLINPCSAQKEYHNWYFSHHCGLDFNYGGPQPLFMGSTVHQSCASISDSLGNILLYTDGYCVYDRTHRSTPNGIGLYGQYSGQGSLILQKPGSNNLYYIINIYIKTNDLSNIPQTGLFYSIFDITLNNGLGDIITGEKNKPIYLPLSGYALEKLTAVKHKNNRDIWIVTRNFPGDKFYSFLLTAEGLGTVGKISQSLILLDNSNPFQEIRGELNISPNGTQLAAVYEDLEVIEYGAFDIATGIYYPQFIIRPDTINSGPGASGPVGLEFSPNSRLLYCCQNYGSSSQYDNTPIQQFDLSIADSAFVKNSEITIGNGIAGTLQSGPDGKIYGGLLSDQYISVIHNPNERGIFCNFDFRAVPLGDGNRYYLKSLPQMLQKYFSYINYTATCINQPTLFTPNIYPVPDSVFWNFGDASSGSNDTSSLLNPSHIYSVPDDYSVTLISYWSGGRSDTSTKVISLLPAPLPNIGDTAFICKGDSITLESDVFESYLWSNWDTTRLITVADTGTYRIEVTNTLGCIGRDTVRVKYFPPPSLGDSVLISPTACNGSTGAIRELTITGVEPVSVWWLDSYDNLIDTTLDIYNLPADWYSLWATDGNGCTNFIDKFYIPDAGNVLIESVDHQPAYCNNNNGTITITAVSGLSDMLEYSVRAGEWLANEGQFTALEPGEYVVKVRVIDSTGCQATWSDKIIITDEPGPLVNATTEPETDNNQNGTVTLTAEGFGDITFVLNGMTQDTGYYTGLAHGTYYYQVIDQNGCITADSITVINIQGFILSAIAGSDTVCYIQKLTVPLEVTNFNQVKAFELGLRYDATRVKCTNHTAVNNQLPGLSVEVFPTVGRIVASWNDTNAVTLSGTGKLFELVFTAIDTGFSQLAWDVAGQSWFEGINGPLTNVEFTVGNMQVNEAAAISTDQAPVCCEGEILTIAPSVTGTAPLSYQWTLPDGSIYDREMFISFNAQQENAGDYSIRITDGLGCEDSIKVNARVVAPPTANFPEIKDTIWYEQTYLLQATTGYSSYEWSTGDSTYYITVTDEGRYSVILQTEEGCRSSDTVMMMNAFVPIYIPNAFTPNGDGLNDVFRPVVDLELVKQFHLSIYNKWGERIFETSDAGKGWDGKDCLPGVYVWVISYENRVGKREQIKGSVMVVK